ncbi:porin family protein [Winogradskyella pulchriflava]|uniref:Porin family protein n=1 Tax=Winogradskyella pulchriflava TaxID=1110688 RepID=A0ABV6Q850_9FLAO
MRHLIYLVFLIGLSINAQEHSVGVKVGGNIASLVGDGTSNLSSMTNFHAGFFMEIRLTKDVKIQPELLFTVYGFKQNGDGPPKVRLNYVALPVMAKYFVSKSFSFDAGPQVGILVTARNGTGSDANVKSAFYDRDFGVNAGVSYAISDKVSTSLRYYFGLTDVTAVSTKNYNRALQFALQFKIN